GNVVAAGAVAIEPAQLTDAVRRRRFRRAVRDDAVTRSSERPDALCHNDGLAGYRDMRHIVWLGEQSVATDKQDPPCIQVSRAAVRVDQLASGPTVPCACVHATCVGWRRHRKQELLSVRQKERRASGETTGL